MSKTPIPLISSATTRRPPRPNANTKSPKGFNPKSKDDMFQAKILKLSIDFFNVARDVQANLKDKGTEVSFEEAVARTYNLIEVVAKVNKG